MVSKYNFIQALNRYSINLQNSNDFNPPEGYETPEGATVNMRVNHKGQLIVTKAETFKNEASILEGKLKDAENELKRAKKTVSTQEKTIEDLTAQLKEAEAIQEEPKPEEVETTKKKRR